MTKYVYFFGDGKAEGAAAMKPLLGGKGANLAEMTNIGLPVPPGFTISTEVCDYFYKHKKSYPGTLKKEIESSLAKLEKMMKRRLGDEKNPLLVSVRSGAAVSMPGMMDTVLNLGLNDTSVQGLVNQSGNERFAYDAYRRFIAMFGNVVMGIEGSKFEEKLKAAKKKRGVENDTELLADDLKALVQEFKAVFKAQTKTDFPQNPKEQLQRSIDAVFGSWNNERAIEYRRMHQIGDLLGTAVNVQSMVFGNLGETSGTGVCFTRNPSTGENYFYGEFLMNAQGEDVVAGIRTPLPILNLQEVMPDAYKKLLKVRSLLERHYKDMQDIEFTIQDRELYLLQTRNGKRTGAASVRIAVDLLRQGLINDRIALTRVDGSSIEQMLFPILSEKSKQHAELVGTGLPAGPGAAVGRIYFTAKDAEHAFEAERAAAKRENRKADAIILVREETSPEDIKGMKVSVGILTARGGMTSHAAVVARQMGKCCIVGCSAVEIAEDNSHCAIGGRKISKGDWLSLDGTHGQVFLGNLEVSDSEVMQVLDGKIKPEKSEVFAYYDTMMKIADKYRTLKVRTNADTPRDTRRARQFGAEGIGLTRSEHMFFDDERIIEVRKMIFAAEPYAKFRRAIAVFERKDQLSRDDQAKLAQLRKESKEPERQFRAAIEKIYKFQRDDFEGIFREMDGLPVTIRLLDPPLHEFLPRKDEDDKIKKIANELGVSTEEIKHRIVSLHESNPMLGHRGCRLSITYPEICVMQVRAIIDAACNVAKKKTTVIPEIMVPLVAEKKEFDYLEKMIRETADGILAKRGVKLHYLVGTMIEIPRAAVMAAGIAETAEFFSFGTNDLTQMTYGFSRDDVEKFVGEYIEHDILAADPFQTLDQKGVGQLIAMGIERGRSTRSDLKIGICGEHGGDPASVVFCHNVGMNYVSCSPLRVPTARIAAGQAKVRELEASFGKRSKASRKGKKSLRAKRS
ncbi:MAG: pyruvate, phosphate dikinase [Planctomycetes bacterium]|nr:pyruvate, phosphate dikinase [Planctomycetota bacterium]